VPAPQAVSPRVDGSVFMESVQPGGFREALHHIPLIGHNRTDDYIPPSAVRSFAPKIPVDIARQMTAPEAVDLKLKVDNTGRVTSVEVLSRETPPDFVRLAGNAAYDWQFDPAHLKDKAVSSEVIAHFRFRPTSY
jgi:TonB family protein